MFAVCLRLHRVCLNATRTFRHSSFSGATKSEAPRRFGRKPLALLLGVALVLLGYGAFLYYRPDFPGTHLFSDVPDAPVVARRFDGLQSMESTAIPLPLRVILIIDPFDPLPVQTGNSTGVREPYNAKSLDALLRSLEAAQYGGDVVHLQGILSPHANATSFANLYSQFRRFSWTHGNFHVMNASSGGLFEQVTSAWVPNRNDREPVIIVEASRSTPFSPQWYRYLVSVRKRFGSSADVAGFGLDPVKVRTRSAQDKYGSQVIPEGGPGEEVFLYTNLPLTSAFSPASAEVWHVFQRWFNGHRSEWFLWPRVVSAKDNKDEAWNGFRGTARAHWTLWFSRFCAQYGLFMVYPRHHHPEPLSSLNKIGEVRPLLRYRYDGSAAPVSSRFGNADINSIVELGRQQGGTVSLTIVNSAFLETAHSWICNVEVAGLRPPGIVWVTTDDESFNTLSKVKDTFALRMSQFRGGQADKGTSFGSPGYWLLMLERTMLIRDILERGIGIFAFETDQIWLRDPIPFIHRIIHSGDEVDLVGTLDTRRQIAGNFLYLNPTLATRRLWREVCGRFEKAYRDNHLDSRSSHYIRYVENDQSILTKLVLYDESFKAQNPVVFRALDTELFVDGRWYRTNPAYYTSAKSRSPIMVNNNFLVGIDKKKVRAKEFGHWFWEDGKCDVNQVIKAIKVNEEKGKQDGIGEEVGQVVSDQSDDGKHVTPTRIEGADFEAGLDAALKAIAKEGVTR